MEADLDTEFRFALWSSLDASIFVGVRGRAVILSGAPRPGAVSAGSGGNAKLRQQPARQEQIEDQNSDGPKPSRHSVEGLSLLF